MKIAVMMIFSGIPASLSPFLLTIIILILGYRKRLAWICVDFAASGALRPAFTMLEIMLTGSAVHSIAGVQIGWNLGGERSVVSFEHRHTVIRLDRKK